MSNFDHETQWLLLEFHLSITSTYFYLDFHVALPKTRLRGQIRAILAQIHCQYTGGTGAADPWQPARPNQPETHITPRRSHLRHTVPLISHLLLTNHTFWLTYHRIFVLYRPKKCYVAWPKNRSKRYITLLYSIKKGFIRVLFEKFLARCFLEIQTQNSEGRYLLYNMLRGVLYSISRNLLKTTYVTCISSRNGCISLLCPLRRLPYGCPCSYPCFRVFSDPSVTSPFPAHYQLNTKHIREGLGLGGL